MNKFTIWTNSPINEFIDEWIHRKIHQWIKRINKWIHRWMNSQMNSQMNSHFLRLRFWPCIASFELFFCLFIEIDVKCQVSMTTSMAELSTIRRLARISFPGGNVEMEIPVIGRSRWSWCCCCRQSHTRNRDRLELRGWISNWRYSDHSSSFGFHPILGHSCQTSSQHSLFLSYPRNDARHSQHLPVRHTSAYRHRCHLQKSRQEIQPSCSTSVCLSGDDPLLVPFEILNFLFSTSSNWRSVSWTSLSRLSRQERTSHPGSSTAIFRWSLWWVPSIRAFWSFSSTPWFEWTPMLHSNLVECVRVSVVYWMELHSNVGEPRLWAGFSDFDASRRLAKFIWSISRMSVEPNRTVKQTHSDVGDEPWLTCDADYSEFGRASTLISIGVLEDCPLRWPLTGEQVTRIAPLRWPLTGERRITPLRCRRASTGERKIAPFTRCFDGRRVALHNLSEKIIIQLLWINTSNGRFESCQIELVVSATLLQEVRCWDDPMDWTWELNWGL